MVLSKNAEANIRFISDCLEEADIGTGRNNVIYIQHGVVMIVSPEEEENGLAAIRELCCHFGKKTTEYGLAIVTKALEDRLKGGMLNG